MNKEFEDYEHIELTDEEVSRMVDGLQGSGGSEFWLIVMLFMLFILACLFWSKI